MATSKTVEVSAEAFEALEARVKELEAKIEGLSKPSNGNSSQKEMTDADARNVMNGECKDLKHNDAAKKLGLSYGQVYSCRLGYTFKHIHKEMRALDGYKNPWIKE